MIFVHYTKVANVSVLGLWIFAKIVGVKLTLYSSVQYNISQLEIFKVGNSGFLDILI